MNNHQYLIYSKEKVVGQMRYNEYEYIVRRLDQIRK